MKIVKNSEQSNKIVPTLWKAGFLWYTRANENESNLETLIYFWNNTIRLGEKANTFRKYSMCDGHYWITK